MADAFQPRFVDLVRNYTISQGTGPFVLGPAVQGFNSFASALQAGDQFYYSAIGVDKPNEREVGRGTLQADGSIARTPIGAAETKFTGGSKTVALIAAAEWFTSVQAGAGGGGSTTAATRATLATKPAISGAVMLTERGREGTFLFDGSNLKSKCSADPNQGIYVAPAGQDGTSGAWVREFEGPVWAHWFGAAGNGVVGSLTAGTDDTAAIQAAVNTAILLGIGKVLLADGKTYRVDGTIKLGIANGFSTVAVEGAGLGYSAGYGVGSATIYHTAKDRPCFNLSRGRGTGVRRLFIVGQNSISEANWQNLPYRANAANYVTNGCQDTARAPHCAVAVDGDGLIAPPTPYGGMTYSGVASGTSDWFVEDCTISQFVVGVACQPNHDSNGDFGSLRNTRIRYCKAGVSIGNVNARSTDFAKANFFWCHTCIDGMNYRNVNRGNIAGELGNIHVNFCFQIYNVALQYSCSVTLENCYCEGTIRIGQAISAGNKSALSHRGCTFNLEHQLIYSGSSELSAYVTALIDYSGSYSFDSCTFGVLPDFIGLRGTPTFDNCSASTFYGVGTRTMSSDKAAAWTATYGFLIHDRFQNFQRGGTFRSPCHQQGIAYDFTDTDTYLTASIYGTGYCFGGQHQYLQPGVNKLTLSASGFSNVAINGKTVTFDLARLLEVGGLIQCSDADTVLLILSRSGAGPYTYTAEALSEWTLQGGSYGLIKFTTFPAENYYVPPNLSFRALEKGVYCKTTAGSPTVQFCDARGVNMTALPNAVPALTTSTRLFWAADGDHWLRPFPSDVKISALTAASGQATMSASALRTGVYRFASGIAAVA